MPRFIEKRIEGRPYLRNVVANAAWLFSDKLVKIGIGLFVNVWVARYLGPGQFGQLSYAIAFIAIFSSLSSLGLDGIVIRNLVRFPARKSEILGSAALLKVVAGSVTALLSVGLILVLDPGNRLKQTLVAVTAAGMIFQSLNVIDFWFQSRVQSKYVVLAQGASFLSMSLVKIWLILGKASVTAFAVVGMLEVSLGYLSLVPVYRACREDIGGWRARRETMASLLRDSWPLMVASLCSMLYTRIDQVMLGEMIGDASVGIYSAAVRLADVWYFFPAAVVSSVIPAIVESKEMGEDVYYGRLVKLFSFMTALSLAVSTLLSLFSGPVIRLVFGREYGAAAPVLAIYIWSSVFSTFGAVQSVWEMTEGLTRYTLFRTVSGAVLSIALNSLIIPKYEGLGSAAAIVLSQAVSMYFINSLTKTTRPMFLCQTKSFLFFRHMK